MSSVNARSKRPAIHTHEGAPAKHVNVRQQLERSVMSCLLWEDEFYEDGQKISDRIRDLSKQVDAETLADIAIRAKQDMRLRHVPLLLGRQLLRSKDGRKLFGKVAEKIITRPDDIPEFLAIYWADQKDAPIAKQAKKHLGNAFRRFDEYQLQKYNGGSKAIKLKDVMKLARPKPEGEEQAALWSRLIKDELATPDTWEVAISEAGAKTKDATEKAQNKKETWERLLKEDKLGGLAMLRNIRNMREANIEPDLIKRGISKINAGKLLPINFIASATHNPQFEPQLELKFLECFAKKQKYSGKTTILIDVSGSMDDKLSGKSELRRMDVACSLAMIAREMFEDLRVFTFSNHLKEVPPRQGFALRDGITTSQSHGGTELGKALRELPACERLIVITDEQSHDPVPNMKGYLINVASAQNGVGYGSWVHIDGWSDKVLDYLMKYEESSAR